MKIIEHEKCPFEYLNSLTLSGMPPSGICRSVQLNMLILYHLHDNCIDAAEVLMGMAAKCRVLIPYTYCAI